MDERGYAGRYRGELESCPILLLFSSLVFRASPRTAFKCSMQAKARGLLPRIRVVALQGLPFHEEIFNSVGMLFAIVDHSTTFSVHLEKPSRGAAAMSATPHLMS